MSLTIYEVLQNAKWNLCRDHPSFLQIQIGKEQLKNAMDLLELDFGLYDDFDQTKLPTKSGE